MVVTTSPGNKDGRSFASLLNILLACALRLKTAGHCCNCMGFSWSLWIGRRVCVQRLIKRCAGLLAKPWDGVLRQSNSDSQRSCAVVLAFAMSCLTVLTAFLALPLLFGGKGCL